MHWYWVFFWKFSFVCTMVLLAHLALDLCNSLENPHYNPGDNTREGRGACATRSPYSHTRSWVRRAAFGELKIFSRLNPFRGGHQSNFENWADKFCRAFRRQGIICGELIRKIPIQLKKHFWIHQPAWMTPFVGLTTKPSFASKQGGFRPWRR